MKQMRSVLEAAIAYVTERHWHVFPAPPGEKKGCTSAARSNGNRWGATDSKSQVCEYWQEFPDANVGIATGESHIFVLEADTVKGHEVDGLASLQALTAKYGALPDTLMAESPSGSLHHYFKAPNGRKVWNSQSAIAPGIDVKGDGGMVIAPPSVKPKVGAYRWLNNNELAEAPDWLLDLVTKQTAKKSKGQNADKKLDQACAEMAATAEGSRNATLNQLAYHLGKLISAGQLAEPTVRERLAEAARSSGLADKEIAATIESGVTAGKKSKPEEQQAPKPLPPRRSREEVHAIFRKWFGDDYDFDVLDVTLAAAAAERLTGDPLWLLIVGGAGGAKTETASAVAGADGLVISTIASEGALLSATRPRAKKPATGGLLRKIGERGVLVIKDFGSILSSDRNVRSTVLAALREIYDGKYVRNVGLEGGQTIGWTGRIAIIGAVTTAWDEHHAVVAVMGDRFVLVRLDSTTGRVQAGLHAIDNVGTELEMRAELAEAVGGLVLHASTEEVTLTREEIKRLVKLADIVTRARTAVVRDGKGEVIDAHAPEYPTRYAKQLTQVVRGGGAIGMKRGEAMRLAVRCARDSIPPLRLAILLDVVANPDTQVNHVRQRIEKPWTTIKREMMALHMLGILRCREEEEEDEEGHKKGTVWLYSVVDGFFDDESLRLLGGRTPEMAKQEAAAQGKLHMPDLGHVRDRRRGAAHNYHRKSE
jgi:hypothetical protein